MALQRVPITNIYANVEQVSIGPFSEGIWNAYVTEMGTIHRGPGFLEFANLMTVGGVDGLYPWDRQQKAIAVAGGKVHLITDTNGNYDDVTNAAPEAGTRVIFAEQDVTGYGNSVFMCNGGELLWLTPTTSTVLNGGLPYTCIKNHKAAADNEPGVGVNWATHWTQSGTATDLWSVTDTWYTSGKTEAMSSHDPDVPTACTHVLSVFSYLVVNEAGTGRFWWSTPGDPAGWEGEFATAEIRADNITALIDYWQEIYAIGRQTVEVWSVDGVTPIANNVQRFVDDGVLAPYSAMVADNLLYYLNKDRHMVRLSGRTPQVVSVTLDKLFADLSAVDDAQADLVRFRGRSFLVVSFPTAGKTFAYDLLVGTATQNPPFSEWAFYDTGTASFIRHPINCSAYCPWWNLQLIGDYRSGKVHYLSDSRYQHDGEPMRSVIRTGQIDHGTMTRKRCRRLIIKGLRDNVYLGPEGPISYTEAEWPIGWDNAKKVYLRYRDDGSTTWSDPVELLLSDPAGDTSYTIDTWALGSYRTRQWEFYTTDDLPLAFAQLEEDVELLKS